MSRHHHHSLSHPSASARRHVKYPSDLLLPITPPLTPAAPPPATRIISLSNLHPALDPSLLERTIHQILPQKPALRVKGLNTRSLPTTHAVPIVFFDSRDARTVLDAVSQGSPSLHALASHGKVAAQMISVQQLIKDIGPSPFLHSIDAPFHLRVSPLQEDQSVKLPILQSLLSTFGDLCTFIAEFHPPEQSIVIYHIEYFDSRDGDRAILELDGKVLFGMSLAVEPVGGSRCRAQQDDHDDWESELEVDPEPALQDKAEQTLKNIEFPSISRPASASIVANEDADTFQKPELALSADPAPKLVIGPPGSVSNLRVRFRSLGQVQTEEAEAGDVNAALVREAESESDGEIEGMPTVLYASSSASASLQRSAGPGPVSATSTAMDTPHTTDTNATTTTTQRDDVAPSTSESVSAITPTTGAETAVACYSDPPDGICFYCPTAASSSAEVDYPHAHLQPPPPPSAGHQGALTAVTPPYRHYAMPPANSSAGEPTIPPVAVGPDPGIVYYPSLSGTPTSTPPTTGMTTPIMTPGGYEYFDAHYGVVQGHPGLSLPGSPGPPGVGWGGYDPSMMMPIHMGMNMGANVTMTGVGMGMVPLMGVNMNMNMGVGMNMGMMPPPHGYYSMPRGDESGGRYVGPYGHPPTQHQYGVAAGVTVNGVGSGMYAHHHYHQSQNQRFAGSEGVGTPSASVSGSGSSAGSSCKSMASGRINGSYNQQGRGTSPPPMGTAGRLSLGLGLSVGGSGLRGSGYKERDKERDRGKERRDAFCLNEQQHHHQPHRRRSCSRDGSSPAHPHAPTSLLGIHYDDDDHRVTSDDASPAAAAPSERNQLNIKRIEDGLDTRTTVMIKNIPNKMSDRDLIAFIERVCPRRIDFFYLRMDFQNGCNVGYAFVNFIHVQELLRFAKARLGVKWNMFSSEKVLQMSYANYQGKEALVEKFKNSAIMDEREAWRPRIFFSSGPNQGLPEPFPPPTHMRRKERSFFNRGALFVPGGERVASQSGSGMEARRGMRGACAGGSGNGSEALVMARDFAGVGYTLGKSWMGRTAAAGTGMTRNGAAGAASDLEEGEEEFGGV